MPPPPPPLQLYSISFSFPDMVDLYCVESCDVDLLPAHMILEKNTEPEQKQVQLLEWPNL